MPDFSGIKDAGRSEDLIMQRGLALLAGLLGGAGYAATGLAVLLPETMSPEAGIVGYLTLGWMQPAQAWMALGITLGGLLGALVGQWLWLILGQVQRWLAPLPATDALTRAAVPMAALLPLGGYLVGGRPVDWMPVAAWGGLAVGCLLLALLEKRDKRKIFFAHPTESEYHPGSLFTHGGVISLGVGVGWFVQSLPSTPAVLGGLWIALFFGIAVWIATLLLTGLLSLLFSKQTFDQVYAGVALACLPLAVLPLQTFGWYEVLGHPDQGFYLSWLPFFLASLAGAGWLAIMLFVILRVRRQPVAQHVGWDDLFQALMLITAIPLLVLAAVFWPAASPVGQAHLAGPLDFFREGESLAAAQAMLQDKLPFKEILFRHGFGSDALSGLAAIQWFGHDIMSYRWLLAWLMPVGVMALYVLSVFCVPWVWSLVLMLTLVTGHLGAVPAAQFFFPVGAFVFTLYFLQRTRWIILLFAGLFTGLALMVSYTAGLTALAGVLVLLAAYILTGTGRFGTRLAHGGLYLGSFVVAVLPWMLYLAMSGSLGAYFQNLGWVVTRYPAVFGLPLSQWETAPTLGRLLWFALPPLVLIAGILVVFHAWRSAKENGLPWNVLLLTVFTLLLWYRFLNRSQPLFFAQVLPVAGMLAVFFLYRLTARQRRLRGAVFLAFLPALLLPVRGGLDLPTLVGGFGAKNRISVEGLVRPDIKNTGSLYVPAEQAGWLRDITAYLDEQVGTIETFFDFSNRPLLYFLVPRRPPVNALSTAALATFAQQKEAVAALETQRVKAVIWSRGTVAEAGLDGIPSEVRQYAVADYLLRRFVPTTVIGDTVILSPITDGATVNTDAAAALVRSLELDSLPWVWGRDSRYDPAQGSRVGGFSALPKQQALETAGVTVTARGNQVEIGASAGPTMVELQAADQKQYGNALVLELAAPPELDRRQAVLTWKAFGQPVRLNFRLRGSGQPERYAFRVGAVPAWVFSRPVTALTLTLPGGGWTLAQGALLSVLDLPEFKPAESGAPAK